MEGPSADSDAGAPAEGDAGEPIDQHDGSDVEQTGDVQDALLPVDQVADDGLVDGGSVPETADGMLVPDTETQDQPVPAPTCTDGKKNGSEADIDCGGAGCGPCGVGASCAIQTDCKSQQCVAGLCLPDPTCSDGIKNAAETDVDCGGSTCPKCNGGAGCTLPADCASNICQAGKCLGSAMCLNGKKDGLETDIDCGGPNCSPCAPGKTCLSKADCDGGACLNNFCQKLDCSVPNVCDDGNGCTMDSCSAGGCGHVSTTGSCSDGNSCTAGDACSGGLCVGGKSMECSDGNACTTDGCEPVAGCTHLANSEACSDGNACTTNDACSLGACTGAPSKCDDGKACTVDSCDPISGCKFTIVASAEVCDDADNDCNGAIDEGCDDDKDGYCDALMTVIGTPAACAKDNGGAAPGKPGADCADTTAAKNPGVAEICGNGVDDNCKGGVDEGCGSVLTEICNGQDDDGNGKTDDVVCGSGACTCSANGNGVAVCPSDCTVCPDNGDLAILIDDAGVKKVACAHDYPAWWKNANISPNGLVDKGDGSVFDTLTGLYWQKDGSAAANDLWATQKAYCDALVLAGKSDWRLPTQSELQSLVDFGKTACPAASAVLAGFDCFSFYWTATPFQGGSSFAWVVDFNYGDGHGEGVTVNCRVRCVR